MGTRSLTVFVGSYTNEEKETIEKEIAVLYKQYDGYPTGWGDDLAGFLKGFSVVNGLPIDDTRLLANGMGCLAAQVVARFKQGAGDIYLEPAGTRDAGEEWIYTIRKKDGRVHLTVEAGSVTFFGLPGTKQKNMPVVFDGFVEDFDANVVEETTEALRKHITNDFLEGEANG